MAKQAVATAMQRVVHLSFEEPAGHNAWTPNTDVYETATAVVIKMELAGVAADDLEIIARNRSLIVSGRREDICRQHAGRCTFRQMEIDYGHFERRILLPQTVDVRRAEARLRNGFLRVQLPKTATVAATEVVTVVIEPVA